MKRQFVHSAITIVAITGMAMLFSTCKKDESLPMVITLEATAITNSSASVGGNVSSDGGATVTERGIYWSTSQNPEKTGTKMQIGAGTWEFSSILSGLNTITTYYIKAYATNAAGTAYGNQLSFTTNEQVTDYDGNIYDMATIGTQVWMKENLKTTHYNDGAQIQLVTDNTTWANMTSGAYCYYNNNTSYDDIYGALYNWYTVNTGKLCPTGWHVPTDAEWTTLTDYLGGASVAGGKLKEAGTEHWQSQNTGATNESVFTALPGGGRGINGMFYGIGTNGYWWSSTEYGTDYAWHREMYYGSVKVYRNNYILVNGFSVRCLRD